MKEIDLNVVGLEPLREEEERETDGGLGGGNRDTRRERKNMKSELSIWMVVGIASLVSVIFSYGPDIIRRIIHFFIV